MASKEVIKILKVLVKEEGMDKVVSGLESINKGQEKTGKSANKLKRNLEGVGKAGLSSGKAFARQAQGMGGLVQAYATVAANVFALSSAFLVLQRNADLQIMIKASSDLSASTGINFTRVAQSMKEVTLGALSMKEAMQSANLAIASGLDAQQVRELSEVATKAAQATGRDAGSSVQRLIQAVSKGEPELADELGIIIRVQKAVDDYAAAHNKAASELTTFERQQAIAIQTIERGNNAYRDVTIRQNEYTVLLASLKDLTNEVIALVSGPISAVANVMSNNTALMIVSLGILVKMVAKKAIPLFQDFTKTVAESSTKMAQAAVTSAEKQVKNLEKINVHYEYLLTSKKAIAKKLEGVPLNIFDSRSAAGKALKKGVKGGELVEAFGTSLKNPKFRKALDQLFDDLEDTSKTRMKFMGEQISRDQGRAILAALLQVDEGLTKGFQARLGRKKEIIEGVSKGTLASIKTKMAQLSSGIANTQAALWNGVSQGIKMRFFEAFTFANAELNKFYANAKAQNAGYLSTFVRIQGAAYKLGVVGGAAANAIASGFSKLIVWATWISVIVALFSQVAKWIGISNEKLDSQVDKGREAADNLDEINERIKTVAEAELKRSQSLDQLNKKYTAQVSILDEIRSSLTDMQNAAEAASMRFQLDFAQWNIFGGVKESDVLNAVKGAQTAANAVGKDFKTTIKGITIDTSKSFEQLSESIEDNLDIKDRATFIWQLIQQLKEFMAESTNARKEMQALGKFYNQFVTTLDRRAQSFSKDAIGATSVGQELQQLRALDRELKKARGTQKEDEVVESYNAFVNELSVGTRAFIGVQGDVLDGYEAQFEVQDAINKLAVIERTELQNKALLQAKSNDLILAQSKAQAGAVGGAKNVLDIQRERLQLQIKEVDAALAYARVQRDAVKVDNPDALVVYEAKIDSLIEKRIGYTNRLHDNLMAQRAILKDVETSQININRILDERVAKAETAAKLAKSEYDRGAGSIQKVQDAEQLAITEKIKQVKQNILNIQQQINASNGLTTKQEQFKLDKVKEQQKLKELEDEKVSKVYGTARKLLKIEEDKAKLAREYYDSIASNTDLYTKQENLQANIAKQAAIVAEYAAKENIIRTSNKTLAEKDLELLNLKLKKQEDLLEAERERIDLALRAQTEAFSPSGMKAIGDKFAMMSADFAKKIKSSAELFVDTVTAGMDGAIDAFGDALLNGFEGGLKETFRNMGKAIVDGMNEVIVDQLKNQLKTVFRGIMGNIFGGSFGKPKLSPELMEAQKQTLQQTRIATNTDVMVQHLASTAACSCKGQSPIPGDSTNNVLDYVREKLKTDVDVIDESLEDGGNIFTSAFRMFKDIFKSGSLALANGISNLVNSLSSGGGGGGIFGSILTSIAGAFLPGPVPGGSYGGYSTGGGFYADLNFAKGGVMTSLGEMQLKRYAAGGIAKSPQIAMYGEGSVPEAYVPLPDGRTIPVTVNGELNGVGGGTINNVTVVINYEEGDKTTQQSTGQSQEGVRDFSNIITQKVQQELIRQSRPGGLLSR